jgi:Mce-associated membrane protein
MSRSARRFAVPVLAVVVLLLAAGVGWTAVSLHARSVAHDERVEALGAARQAVLDVTTYDAAHIQQQVAAIQHIITGSFQHQFTTLESRIQRLVQAGISARGQVVATALTQLSSSAATVLVAADEFYAGRGVTSAQSQQHFRMKLQLVDQDGRWLVSNISEVA